MTTGGVPGARTGRFAFRADQLRMRGAPECDGADRARRGRDGVPPGDGRAG
ncbi:hypothetical protein HTV45_22385 [Streptomyces sp. CHD11]|uniref:hypothetical protein n=1 Tax=Streptomyces sp. CHD11 TaxID=2741325 RepID=UPI001BFCC9E8|nr:hypothetical protein [Streptomyces sp. CHD11]MBT3153580.1 hypothetical protein [Streptomyces sp. CHD11]